MKKFLVSVELVDGGKDNYIVEAEDFALVPQECYKLGHYVHPDNVIEAKKSHVDKYPPLPQQDVLFVCTAYSHRYVPYTTRAVYAQSSSEAESLVRRFLELHNVTDVLGFSTFIEMPLNRLNFQTENVAS